MKIAQIAPLYERVPPLLYGGTERIVAYLTEELVRQGHEVTLFHIMHRDELEFGFTGNIRFDGLEIPEELKTRPHLIRPNYLRVVQSYLEELRKGCEAYRVDYVLMDTAKPLAVSLNEYLVRRLQLGRMVHTHLS